MSKRIREYLALASRPKIYLILVFISLTLVFYSIWQIKPVIVAVDVPLGLASHFTSYYWAGLALLLLVSIAAFLDRELKGDALFLLILIVLGLSTQAIEAFAYAEIRDPNIYYPISEANNLLEKGRFDIANPPQLGAYYSWPAVHFLSASILSTTGLEIGFIKYFPIVWVLFMISITYGLGKRLELPPHRCFLLSFLVLSSWNTMVEYHPHSLGMLFFVLLFMLLLRSRYTFGENIVAILVFAALVITHGFSSMSVLFGLAMLAIYRKETRFIALFVVLFAAWFIYQASAAMQQGTQTWLTGPLTMIFHVARRETAGWASAPARFAARYSQLSFLAIYVSLVAGSAILLLRGRIAEKHRKWVISSFAWAIGTSLLILSGYGTELQRIYLFGLVPAVVIAVLSFTRGKVATATAIALLLLTPVLHLPAKYGVDAAWTQVLTTEVKGAEFFATKVPIQPPQIYFTTFCNGAEVILYHNPKLINVSKWDCTLVLPWPETNPPVPDLSVLDRIDYVILSQEGTRADLFAFGVDRYAVWPESEGGGKVNPLYWKFGPDYAWPDVKGGKRADSFYDNGYYKIYQNAYWKQPWPYRYWE